MFESPDVAIIQHASGVMQVAHNLFENASTYSPSESLLKSN
jgi:K+-sensing histidine kinase KdpD